MVWLTVQKEEKHAVFNPVFTKEVSDKGWIYSSIFMISLGLCDICWTKHSKQLNK